MQKLKAKEFFKSESFRMIAVLAAIALVASLLLSVVHRYTLVDEAARLQEALGAAYPQSAISKTLSTETYADLENSDILGAYMAEDGACLVLSKSAKAYNAATGITLIVIIKDGEILAVKKYEASETPGLGEKALKDDYLNRYVGLDADDLAEKTVITSAGSTSNVKVDNVSGATKSSNGVRIAIRAAATYYVREVAENE